MDLGGVMFMLASYSLEDDRDPSRRADAVHVTDGKEQAECTDWR